jgi:hypothetical protein
VTFALKMGENEWNQITITQLWCGSVREHKSDEINGGYDEEFGEGKQSAIRQRIRKIMKLRALQYKETSELKMNSDWIRRFDGDFEDNASRNWDCWVQDWADVRKLELGLEDLNRI